MWLKTGVHESRLHTEVCVWAQSPRSFSSLLSPKSQSERRKELQGGLRAGLAHSFLILAKAKVTVCVCGGGLSLPGRILALMEV